MTLKVQQLTVEIDVLGKQRLVSWDAQGGGTFVIEGIKSYGEVEDILRAVSGPSEPNGSPLKLPYTNPELTDAKAELRSAVAADDVPAAPPVTQPGFKVTPIALSAVKEEQPTPKAVSGGTGAPAATPRSGASGSGTTKSAGAPLARTQVETTSSTTTSAGTAINTMPGAGDLAVFANMTAFQQVVAEIRRRGRDTYVEILAFALNLQAIGDVCPPLDNLVDPRDPAKTRARLEDRLKTHLTKLGMKTD